MRVNQSVSVIITLLATMCIWLLVTMFIVRDIDSTVTKIYVEPDTNFRTGPYHTTPDTDTDDANEDTEEGLRHVAHDMLESMEEGEHEHMEFADYHTIETTTGPSGYTAEGYDLMREIDSLKSEVKHLDRQVAQIDQNEQECIEAFNRQQDYMDGQQDVVRQDIRQDLKELLDPTHPTATEWYPVLSDSSGKIDSGTISIDPKDMTDYDLKKTLKSK